MNWKKFGSVLALLVVGAVLATRGTSDPQVSLNSMVELWSDTLRDTDQIGMKLTRVSDAEEMKIGADLARGVADMGPDDADAARYVTGVAQPLVAHLRRPGIRYQFHVIDSPQINAFALPGGQIYVMRGLLEFVESEAELAAVLGHEMSHVDLRHAIEHYQYEAKLTKAGAPEVGQIVEMAHRLVMLGFSPQQELEADAQGDESQVPGVIQGTGSHAGGRGHRGRWRSSWVVFPHASAIGRASCAIKRYVGTASRGVGRPAVLCGERKPARAGSQSEP
jgi:predicted Zn-dependent protease